MAGFLGAFARDLIEIELGPLPAALPERGAAWVHERIAGAGEVNRIGLSLVGGVVAAAVRVRTGSPYERLPREQRLEIAGRIATSSLPVVAEYVKAVRALAVSYVFEARHASV